MAHSRSLIRFSTAREIDEFVRKINSDGSTDHYTIEDFSGSYRVNARSYLGVIYMFTEHEDLFLVNETEDGKIPAFVDKYRP